MQKRTEQTPRAELATAIAVRNAAATRCDELRAAEERISDELYEARRRIEKAREAHEKAEEECVRRLVEGATAVAAQTMGGRNAVADAEGTIEACMSARALIRTHLADAEAQLGYKELRVRSAAADVAAPAVEQLLSEAQRLHREFEGKRAILKAIAPMLPAELGRKIASAFAESGAPMRTTAVAPWLASLETLMRDPAAPLPREG